MSGGGIGSTVSDLFAGPDDHIVHERTVFAGRVWFVGDNAMILSRDATQTP